MKNVMLQNDGDENNSLDKLKYVRIVSKTGIASWVKVKPNEWMNYEWIMREAENGVVELVEMWKVSDGKVGKKTEMQLLLISKWTEINVTEKWFYREVMPKWITDFFIYLFLQITDFIAN